MRVELGEGWRKSKSRLVKPRTITARAHKGTSARVSAGRVIVVFIYTMEFELGWGYLNIVNLQVQ